MAAVRRVRRGDARWNKAATHCMRGHAFTPENTYLYRGGRNCRACRSACTKRLYHTNPVYRQHCIAAATRRQQKTADVVREQGRARVKQARLSLMAVLGGAECRCCGETTYAFLSFDHINNDGHLDRKPQAGRNARRSTSGRWIKEQLADPNVRMKLQVLCHNCNMAKAFFGECPHKQEAYRQGYDGINWNE